MSETIDQQLQCDQHGVIKSYWLRKKLVTKMYMKMKAVYVTIQRETDLMSQNKFLRYELLKLEVLFFPPN